MNYCTTVFHNYCADSTRKTAGGSGVFGDDGRHASSPCCLQINVERVSERPGIWRPLNRKMNRILKRVVGMCFVDLGNETPETGPAEIMLPAIILKVFLWVSTCPSWTVQLLRMKLFV